MTASPVNYRITFDPTTLELCDLRGWLRAERRGNIGYAHHWPRILKARRAQELACAVLNGQTLGFLFWTDKSPIAVFQVLNVREGFRGHDIGPALVAAVHQRLADPNAGISVITLYCDPPSPSAFGSARAFNRTRNMILVLENAIATSTNPLGPSSSLAPRLSLTIR
jgi:GNAT superfamily N-acetyltransferase